MKLERKSFKIESFDSAAAAGDLDRYLDAIYNAMNTTIDADKTFKFTTPSAADTEFKVIHNLGYIPTRFVILTANGGGVLYKSSSAWDAKVAYFKHSGTSVEMEVVLW